MVDFDEVRKEVAIKHGVLLDENDPMLMNVTVNEVILNQYVEMVASQNAEYVKSVEAAIQKGIADSKLTAGRVITEGGDYVGERVKQSIVSTMDECEANFRKKQYSFMSELMVVHKSIRIAASVAIACAVFSLLVAMKFLGGM
jgi:Transcriptional activator TraM.